MYLLIFFILFTCTYQQELFLDSEVQVAMLTHLQYSIKK